MLERILVRTPSPRPGWSAAKGSVYAFEADLDTYRLLLANIELNHLHNVTVRQTCVSDEVGTVSFFKHKDSAKSSIVDRGEKVAVTLPADKLDNMIPADVKIDILKVDVEGAEMRVLAGATRIFSSPQPPSIVIIEVFDVRDSTDKSAGIRELLEGYGYEFYVYKGQKLTKFSGIALNGFAIHKSALGRVLQDVPHD